MITGPRYKIAKRLGATVFEKAQTQKFAISAERSAKNKRRGRGRQSEYGKQMLEKQKVRITYGLPERQFRNYVRKALDPTARNPLTVSTSSSSSASTTLCGASYSQRRGAARARWSRMAM